MSAIQNGLLGNQCALPTKVDERVKGGASARSGGNTLPTVKQASRSVNKLTSAAFVNMWRQRVDQLHSRYSETAVALNEAP